MTAKNTLNRETITEIRLPARRVQHATTLRNRPDWERSRRMKWQEESVGPGAACTDRDQLLFSVEPLKPDSVRSTGSDVWWMTLQRANNISSRRLWILGIRARGCLHGWGGGRSAMQDHGELETLEKVAVTIYDRLASLWPLMRVCTISRRCFYCWKCRWQNDS